MDKIWKRSMRLAVFACTATMAAGLLLPLASCKDKEKTIAEAYEDYFPVGVALDVDPGLVSFNYDDEFVGQFSSLTAGNEMKWTYTENQPGEYTWE